MAIGRGGVNVNLAAKLTEYRIDAFGKKEYERKRAEQETLLIDIEGMPKRSLKPLSQAGISSVSDLLNIDEDTILEIKGISETSLEKIYDAIQSFVEANQVAAEAEDEEAGIGEVEKLNTEEVLEDIKEVIESESEVPKTEDDTEATEETLEKVES